MIGGRIAPTHTMAKQLPSSQSVLWTRQFPVVHRPYATADGQTDSKIIGIAAVHAGAPGRVLRGWCKAIIQPE